MHIKADEFQQGYDRALKDTLEVVKSWDDTKEKFIEYLELRLGVNSVIEVESSDLVQNCIAQTKQLGIGEMEVNFKTQDGYLVSVKVEDMDNMPEDENE